MIKAHKANILHCNTLLRRRLRSFPWTYHCFLVGATAILLVPSALISTQVIPVLTDALEMWDRFLFFLIFIVVNFIFWMRLHRSTMIRLKHLILFPLSPIRKYELLILGSASDPRSAIGGVLGMVFLISEFPIVVGAVAMLITTILFFLSLEIWLINAMLVISRLLERTASLSYILAVVPMWVLWISIILNNMAFLEWFPLGVWGGKAVSSARLGLWPEFVGNVSTLLTAMLAGLILGVLLIRRRSYLLD